MDLNYNDLSVKAYFEPDRAGYMVTVVTDEVKHFEIKKRKKEDNWIYSLTFLF